MTTFNDKVTKLVNEATTAVKERREFTKAKEIDVAETLGPDVAARQIAEELADEKFAKTLANRELRKEKIDALIEAEFTATGKMPDNAQLERLADALLCEELTDPTPWKMQTTEYPIMNERTFEEHGARDTSSFEADRAREQRLMGKRRRRSDYEERWVDRKSKARNTSRRKTYNDFIEGKSAGVFTVNIATGEKLYAK